MSIVAKLHFFVGCIAVVLGFIAMFSQKGTAIHKQRGIIFSGSITLLCLSGFFLSYSRNLQFTFLLSALALYLVFTGFIAVRNRGQDITILDKIGLVYILLLTLGCFLLSYLGVKFFWAYPATEPPYEAYAFIGGWGLLLLIGDVTFVRTVRPTISTRLKRHLTRMCSAMLIATTVFFLGNNHVLPESMRTVPILVTPIILVCMFMLIYRLGFQWMNRGFHK